MEIFKLFGTILVKDEEALKKLDEFDNKAKNKSERFKSMLSTIGKTAAAIGVAAGGALVTIGTAAFNVSNEFQQSCNQLQASTGATDQEMQKLSGTMKEIYSDNFGESFEDIAHSMELVAQQTNLTDEELKQAVENGYLLSDVFGIEMEESILGVDALINQFGITSEEAYNLIAQGCQNGLNQNGDLMDVIAEFSPMFESAGYTAQDMFNVLYQGASTGAFSISSLGDAFKEMNIKIMDGSADEALKKLGFNADEFRKKYAAGGESAAEVTQAMIDKLYEMDDTQERYNTGVGIFGTMWEDNAEEAILALGSLDGPINSSIDALGEINNQKYDDIGSAIEGIKRNFETGILLPLGQEVLPLFNDFASWFSGVAIPNLQAFGSFISGGMSAAFSTVSGLVTNFKNGLQEVQSWCSQNQTALTILGVAIGTLTVAILAYNAAKIASAAASGAETVAIVAMYAAEFIATGATTVLTAATTALGAVIGFLTSPITLVIAAIGALIAIGVLLYKNWDTVKAYAASAWGAIKSAIMTVLNAIKTGITMYFQMYYTIISTILNTIKTVVSTIWNGVRNVVTNALNSIKSTISNTLNAAKSIVSNIFSSIYNTISSKINSAKNAVKSAIDKIKGFFNFKFSWPKIPLPHFSISPSGWKVGDLLKGSIPSLGIKWYKKGGIMEDPTIFGLAGDKFLAGGEAGPEAILPLDKIQGYFDKAVENNQDNINYEGIDYEKMALVFIKALKTLNLTVVMDRNKVGEIIDEYNGEILDLKEKGVFV